MTPCNPPALIIGKVATMMQRREKELKPDPAYHPTLELTDFTLAAPLRPWTP